MKTFMKTFMKELFANRFGIVLAALNVCYFVSTNFASRAFSHGDGSECFVAKRYVFQWLKFQCADVMLYINLPALAVSAVVDKLGQSVSTDLCAFTQAKFQIIFLAIFITLQWLFIAQMAKTIARAIRPNE